MTDTLSKAIFDISCAETIEGFNAKELVKYEPQVSQCFCPISTKERITIQRKIPTTTAVRQRAALHKICSAGIQRTHKVQCVSLLSVPEGDRSLMISRLRRLSSSPRCIDYQALLKESRRRWWWVFGFRWGEWQFGCGWGLKVLVAAKQMRRRESRW